jgi:large subunit ribosomal protein L22
MKRIRPAPMGRAFRYQRRLTHIVLSVAEREGKAGLATKVDEPAAKTIEPKGAVKAPKAKAPKAKAPAKAPAKKAAAPKKKAASKA